MPSALEHHLLRELAIERYGIDLPPRRRAAIAGRLWPRIAARGLAGYGDYYGVLRACPTADEEWGHFADAITNSETYLFRARGQFDDLVELLPSLGLAGRALRVLSAGCASGEEAYSLAATLATHAHHLPDGFEVVGADVSTPRLAIARLGRFSARSLRSDGASPTGLKFDAHFVRDAAGWTVRDELRPHIQFQPGNLADPGGLGLGTFDVIFCRNVLIYAHDTAWPRFLRTLALALAPGGHLFLGESETLLGRGAAFQPRRLLRHFVYTHAACPPSA